MYPPQQPTQFASQQGRGIGDRTGERGYARQSTLPQAGRGQARIFTLTPQDAQASDAVIAGIILIYYFIIESYLIVSTIHSFCVACVASKIEWQPPKLLVPLSVTTHLSDELETDVAF